MTAPSFKTKPKDAADRREAPFDLDGVTLIARKPKSAAVLDLAGLASANEFEQVQAARLFLDDCLVPESAAHIDDRLHDPEDDFEISDLTPILEWVTEEFISPRPSTPSSGSRPARASTGRGSTARARSAGSTRKTSKRTG